MDNHSKIQPKYLSSNNPKYFKPGKFSKACLNRYYLGKIFPNIYFTKREKECMVLFLSGFTTRKTAIFLNLSQGTVFYYLSTMKNKLNCTTKQELMDKVRESEFLDFIT